MLGIKIVTFHYKKKLFYFIFLKNQCRLVGPQGHCQHHHHHQSSQPYHHSPGPKSQSGDCNRVKPNHQPPQQGIRKKEAPKLAIMGSNPRQQWTHK